MREDKKIVFMGTPEFAKCSLQKLVEENFQVVGVFTNPDKPAGRGMKVAISPVKEYALEKQIPVYQPMKVRNNPEVIEILQALKPDLIVVVAYGKILPKELLDFPRLGCVNVHGSLLPKYRGAAPIQWAIINGEKTTGITTMFMDEGMDTGDMLLREEVTIEEKDTSETMFCKLQKVGADLLVKTLDQIFEGTIQRIKQEGEFSLAPMITKEMTKLDFTKQAIDLVNLVRGLYPLPATYMELENGNRLKVYEAKIVEEQFPDFEPGQICYLSKEKLYIKCADKALAILMLQPLNSRKMDIQSFLAGNQLAIGTKFV